MAPHSSILAWKIPWTEEPGRLQSMKSLGVGQLALILERVLGAPYQDVEKNQHVCLLYITVLHKVTTKSST